MSNDTDYDYTIFRLREPVQDGSAAYLEYYDQVHPVPFGSLAGTGILSADEKVVYYGEANQDE